MNIRLLFLCFLLAGSLAVAGCGKNSPLEPAPQKSNGKVSAQQLIPTDCAYSGYFVGPPAGCKPPYWFDANDNPDYNAIIRTAANCESAIITRVNGGTWGKVFTFPITCTAEYHYIRIFIPTHSASVTWKIVIQEDGGQWRSWTLQDSTAETGYKDYDFAAILDAVNAGSGAFTINIIAEGAVDEYVEVAELYVFAQVAVPDMNNAYWEQTFPCISMAIVHTPGWFDETTNPGYHATLMNRGNDSSAFFTLSSGQAWGKVLGPVITCDTSVFKIFRIKMLNYLIDPTTASYAIGIQEQGGAYRHWWVQAETPFPAPTSDDKNYTTFAWDISSLGLDPAMPFSVELVIVGPNPNARLFVKTVGLYKE